jgi:hypothetical protein
LRSLPDCSTSNPPACFSNIAIPASTPLFRSEDAIVFVTLVEFGIFKCRQVLAIFNNHLGVVEHMFSICRHSIQDERPGSLFRVDQISVSIVIPKGTWVFGTGLDNYRCGSTPRAGDFWRGIRFWIQSVSSFRMSPAVRATAGAGGRRRLCPSRPSIASERGAAHPRDVI